MLNREAPANPITDDREDDVHDKVKEIAVNILIIKWESTGNDSITAELLKADIEFSSEKIHQLMKKIWQYEKIAKRANHQTSKERKYQTLQELERHNLTLCCGNDTIPEGLLSIRIRSEVDDTLYKERTGRIYKRQGDDRTGICTAEHH